MKLYRKTETYVNKPLSDVSLNIVADFMIAFRFPYLHGKKRKLRLFVKPIFMTNIYEVHQIRLKLNT